MNPQFWQPKLWTRQRVRGIRLHVCVMSHSLLPQGDEKRKVGRWSSCAMTCEKTPQLPHLGISVLLEVLIFSVVRCNASLLFVLLSNLRRQRINQAVSSHSLSWATYRACHARKSLYRLRTSEIELVFPAVRTNTLCVMFGKEVHISQRWDLILFPWLPIGVGCVLPLVSQPSLWSARHKSGCERPSISTSAAAVALLPRPFSGCETLLAIQFSIVDDWVVTGQLALSKATLQRYLASFAHTLTPKST